MNCSTVFITLQVNVNYAASNPLLKQIQEGAPVDVFASADQATMDKAVAAKVVDPATRKDFALNDLVLIVPAGSKKPSLFGLAATGDNSLALLLTLLTLAIIAFMAALILSRRNKRLNR